MNFADQITALAFSGETDVLRDLLTSEAAYYEEGFDMFSPLVVDIGAAFAEVQARWRATVPTAWLDLNDYPPHQVLMDACCHPIRTHGHDYVHHCYCCGTDLSDLED